MYVHMNGHAVMAWMYVFETILLCGNKTATDYEFARLLLNLKKSYPDEYDYVLRNFRVMED